MKTTANYMVVADTETGGLPCKASKGKPEKKAFFDIPQNLEDSFDFF